MQARELPKESVTKIVDTDQCNVELKKYLVQDLRKFDASPDGWRGLTAKGICRKEAADLIHDYREHHNLTIHVLFFHEAQLRLFNQNYRHALLLLRNSFVPRAEDKFGWNDYVRATMAFAKRDVDALKTFGDKIASLPYPENSELVGIDGQKVKMKWPRNLEVVDGLLKCFDKDYETAYATPECR